MLGYFGERRKHAMRETLDFRRRLLQIRHDEHRHSRGVGSDGSRFRVLKHDAMTWFDTQPLSRKQEKIRRRFAIHHFISGGHSSKTRQQPGGGELGYRGLPLR